MKLVVFLFSFSYFHSTFAQFNGVFNEVDLYARSAPKNLQSIDELVTFFSNKPSTHLEKARMIYVWLTENISYDARAYNLKNPGDNSPFNVFKTKKAVCAGFANLYTELGEKMGLEIKTVLGLAKGYEFESDVFDNLEESVNHAWNVIKIEGEWRVFDATWGEGFGTSNKKGKLVSTKEFNNTWFSVNPKSAIFSHLPVDNKHQFVVPQVSFEIFLALPFLTTDIFNSGWISPDEILLKAKEKKKIDLPEYTSPLTQLKLTAPKDRILKKGKPHEFILESDEILKAFFYVNENEIVPFHVEGGKFKCTLNSKIIGVYDLVIALQNGQNYVLLQYELE
jgi:hypothetical protein